MTKGKTKQEKPEKENKEAVKDKPVWLKFSKEDINAIVLKLAKQGLTSEKIGLVLRDTYGIPTTKLYSRKISKILKENNLYKDATLENLEKKREKIKKHLEKNKQDKKTQRALTITSARISRLQKYRKREGKKRENVGTDKEIS